MAFLKRNFPLLLLLLSSIVMLYFTLISEGFEGGDDNISLYLRARFSWQHPQLLIDGPIKALYYLLSSPFAQFGFKGMRVMNVILAAGTGWLTYKTSQKLGMNHHWLAIVFLLFAPIYFLITLTGLSEIMFSFFLIFGIYMLISEKYWQALIFLSFLPFVRSEGFVLLGAVACYIFVKGKWKLLPLMAVGTIVYSLAGWSYHHDILWVLHKNYGDASNIYGYGELDQFVAHTRWINGQVLTVLLPLGLIIVFVKAYRLYREKSWPTSFAAIFFLIFGIYFGFLAFHSMLWWLGKGGSLGLIRVMACVMPCAALAGLWTLNNILQRFPQIKPLWLILPLASFQVCIPFITDKYPVKLENDYRYVQEVYDYYESKFKNPPFITFTSNYFIYKTGFDPYDTKMVSDGAIAREWIDKLPLGTIFQYDTHFGPNEVGTPLSVLADHPKLTMEYRATPPDHHTTLGGYVYEVFLFRKTK